jgi:hypothetical protein
MYNMQGTQALIHTYEPKPKCFVSSSMLATHCPRTLWKRHYIHALLHGQGRNQGSISLNGALLNFLVLTACVKKNLIKQWGIFLT